MKKLLGAKLRKPNRARVIFASVIKPHTIFPKIFSLRDKQSPVYDQFYGTCEAYTGIDVKEFQQIRDTGKYTALSAKGLYILCKQNDGNPQEQGTDTGTMLNVGNGGIPLRDDCPDTDPGTYDQYMQGLTPQAVENAGKFRFGGHAELYTDAEIMTAVTLYGNCPITIAVYEDYLSTDKNGVIQQPIGSLVGYHEVSIIGWDNSHTKSPQNLWEIKNHWGTSWADNGYGFLPAIIAGQPSYLEADSVVDWIDPQIAGAPMYLSYPTADPKITQPFGANFNDPDGKPHYAKYGLAGHEGIDFHAPLNTPVYACDMGTVIFAATNGDYGQCIKIQHSWGVSLYAHLAVYKVKIGDTVNPGLQIALSGQTGDAMMTAPHLHFGIKINGVSNPPFKDYVDPAPYFSKGDRMLVFFQVKGVSTIWTLMDGAWVGFSDMTAFNNYVSGRQNVVLQLDQIEFAKIKANPDVFKS